MSDNLLDMFVGSAVPHVYCKKITLENNPDNREWTNVTLLLEMFQERDAISSLSWLNDLNFSADAATPSLLDSFYIKIIAVSSEHNMTRIKKSSVLKEDNAAEQNVYVIKQNDPGADYMWSASEDTSGELQSFTTSLSPPAITGPDLPIKKIHVASSALLGDIRKVIGNNPDDPTPQSVRQEYKNGKWYYVVPFQHTYTYVPSDTNKNLAFAFYSYLDMNVLLGAFDYVQTGENAPEQTNCTNGPPNPLEAELQSCPPPVMVEVADPVIRMMNVEGSINTEIIFENGELAKTRENFIDYASKLWEGPVHYHGTSHHPHPAGYTGFMAGFQHQIQANQARLQLVEAPNTKITDFRDSSVIMPDSEQDHVLGMGKKVSFNIGPNYENVENIISGTLSPFQKEKKRDFIPKNFNEASRLYLARSRENAARGLFYIDFKNMLQNKSQLFSILSPSITGKTKVGVGFATTATANNSEEIIKKILDESKIVELRLYRDRVKPFRMKKAHRKFAKYKTYEEPSRLIGIIKDNNIYKSSTSSVFSTLSFFEEIELTNSADTSFSRYFVFHDRDVKAKQSGLYRYRIEIDFIDGTYSYINKFLDELEKLKIDLKKYLDFALSGKNSSSEAFEYIMSFAKESAQKVYFEPYYNSDYRSFSDDFKKDVEEEFVNKRIEIHGSLDMAMLMSPWWQAPLSILTAYSHFIELGGSLGLNILNLYNMINPEMGSPEGIIFCIRLLESMIQKIQNLIGFNSKQKNINTLTSKTVVKEPLNIIHSSKTYNFKNNSAKTLITEQHIFDHPNEIFDANKNKDFYVDYLSVGLILPLKHLGLRSISPEYYIDRCKLDTLKFCTDLNKAYDNHYIGAILDVGGFSNTEYSYLTPAHIEISDPTQFNKSYEYKYTPFSLSALTHLQTPGSLAPFHSPRFLNYKNYDSIMMASVLHTLDKNNIRNPDLSAAPILTDAKASQAVKKTINNTVVYKKFFEGINLTLHNPSLHYSFFETNRFKTFTKDIDDKDEYPLKKENFSDFGIQTLNFYRSFLFDKKQKIKDIPQGTAVQPFAPNLPNSYKVYHYTRHDEVPPAAASTSPASAAIRDSLKTGVFGETQAAQASKKYNAFKFFNFNMTSEIEVFRGPGSGAHPKDDVWSRLTSQDMNFEQDKKVLFCRIKYWKKKLIGDLEIPIVDKYFLIFPGASGALPPMSATEVILEGPISSLTLTKRTALPPPPESSSGREPDARSKTPAAARPPTALVARPTTAVRASKPSCARCCAECRCHKNH